MGKYLYFICKTTPLTTRVLLTCRMILNNKKILEKYRKRLRTFGTPAEAALWNMIKNKKINGLKFRRQHSIGNYIMDFYCPSIRLCIELDGAQHFCEEGIKKDKRRTAYLNSKNIRVVRFENKIVFEDVELIVDTILQYQFFTTPSPDVRLRRMSGSTPPDAPRRKNPGGELLGKIIMNRFYSSMDCSSFARFLSPV